MHLQRHGGFRVGTDHHHLFLFKSLEGLLQPLDPWVRRQPDFVAEALLRRQAGFAEDLALLTVQFRAGQSDGVQVALGKPAYRCPGVAEQHPTGAMTVQQGIDNGLDRIVRPQQRLQLLTKPGFQQRLTVFPGRLSRSEQRLDHLIHGLVVLLLLLEHVKVMEPRRVQQPQPGEVTLLAGLFRCGGQQQQSAGFLRKTFYGGVLRARLFRAPAQVVGLVHHHQVPARGHGVPLGQGMAGQEIQ